MDYRKYALIDLHLHLDGSLSAESVIKMADMSGTEIPSHDVKEIECMLRCPENCDDLNDYLKCFDLPLSVLQTEETIEYAVYDLLHRLSGQGIICAEIRFAPQLHLKLGLTQKKAVDAAFRGLEKACRETGIVSGLILCCMRGNDNYSENLETVAVASQYIGEKVIGCDLAGAEALFPTEEFNDIFKTASDRSVPFTIHAGEAADIKEIYTAVSFGASRIGHGIRSYNSSETLKMLSDNNIILELCPTSNIDTSAIESVKNISDYPLPVFFRNNVLVTVNTDDMSVSSTTLADEYRKLFENGLITEEQARTTVYNAVKASFVSETEKNKLLKRVREILG